MKNKELNKILAVSLVASIFILIIQLNFCNRAGDDDVKNSSSKKSCNTYQFNDVIKPSNYQINSHKSKSSEKKLNQTCFSENCTIISYSDLFLKSGFYQYFYYQNRIKRPLSKAQLQVYLC